MKAKPKFFYKENTPTLNFPGDEKRSARSPNFPRRTQGMGEITFKQGCRRDGCPEGLSTRKNPRAPSDFFEKIPKNPKKSKKSKIQKIHKIPKIL
jgi:hypothetical protein